MDDEIERSESKCGIKRKKTSKKSRKEIRKRKWREKGDKREKNKTK